MNAILILPRVYSVPTLDAVVVIIQQGPRQHGTAKETPHRGAYPADETEELDIYVRQPNRFYVHVERASWFAGFRLSMGVAIRHYCRFVWAVAIIVVDVDSGRPRKANSCLIICAAVTFQILQV